MTRCIPRSRRNILTSLLILALCWPTVGRSRTVIEPLSKIKAPATKAEARATGNRIGGKKAGGRAIPAAPFFQGGADPEGGVIQINERRAGIIDSNSDADVYQFRGVAGESLHLEVNATTGGWDPAVTLFYGNSGFAVGSGFVAKHEFIAFVPIPRRR